MITARQFRSGILVEINGALSVVISSQHIKPGKGGAFVKAKLKNLQTGSIVERKFRPEESFKKAHIEEKKMQYLYHDGADFHFMDNKTYDQVTVEKDLIGRAADFLKDGMGVTVSVHGHSVIAVNLASTIELKVEYTEPGIKGDTAKAASKLATLETGAKVKVPLFIKTGEIIKIDTRTGEYAGRA